MKLCFRITITKTLLTSQILRKNSQTFLMNMKNFQTKIQCKTILSSLEIQQYRRRKTFKTRIQGIAG